MEQIEKTEDIIKTKDNKIKSDVDINVAIANSFVVIIISALIFSFIYISFLRL